jgi:hypothetical protein
MMDLFKLILGVLAVNKRLRVALTQI